MMNRKSIVGIVVAVVCLLCLPGACGKIVSEKKDSLIVNPYETYNVPIRDTYRGYELKWNWESSASLELTIVYIGDEIIVKVGNHSTDRNSLIIPYSGDWKFVWKNWDNSTKTLNYSITLDDKTTDWTLALISGGFIGLVISVGVVYMWYRREKQNQQVPHEWYRRKD